MAEGPAALEGIVLTHFIVADDIERSRRFYTEVLGGKVVFPGEPTYVALANSWIVISVGGGPTDEKPSVTLETPPDPDRVSSFLNIRGQRHRGRVRRMERPWGSVPDSAEAARVRDPLLHPRSRRSSDRSRANHRPGWRLGAPVLALEHTRRAVRLTDRPADRAVAHAFATAPGVTAYVPVPRSLPPTSPC